jgi:hypothetical protein
MVGATVPDLRLGDGTRLSDHSRQGRALLVDLAGDDRLAVLAQRYAGRVELVRGRPEGAEGGQSAAVGSQSGVGVSGALVRPDGFVAWASSDGVSDPAGLEAALARWFGHAS